MTYLLALTYRPDSDQTEVLADDIYLDGTVVGKLVCRVHDYPGQLPQLPMMPETALQYYMENASEDLLSGPKLEAPRNVRSGRFRDVSSLDPPIRNCAGDWPARASTASCTACKRCTICRST